MSTPTYPEHSEATWRDAAVALLKGRDPDTLRWKAPWGESLPLLALPAALPHLGQAPGAGDHVRGARPGGYRERGWRIAVRLADADAAVAAEEVAGGAQELIAPWPAEAGAREALAAAAGEARLLLTAAQAPAESAPAGAELLVDALAASAAAGVRWEARAGAAREAGADASLELGYGLALGAHALRAGGDPAAVAPRLRLSLTTGGPLLVELAKLRAARLLWSQLLAAFGLPAGARGVELHACQALWTMTRHDPDTNLLRATLAALAALWGGVDSLALRPRHDASGAAPSADERRVIRNVQLVLRDECGLADIADPTGGAHAVEALTDQLARAGWAQLQAIEAEGGALAVRESGWLAARCAAGAEAREQLIARRRDHLIGTSVFADLAEPAPAGEAAGDDPTLPLRRLGAGYERLRAAAQAASVTGLQANLGPSRRFRARADWIADALAVGGIALSAHDSEDVAALAEAWQPAQRLVVACGPDEAYEAALPALAEALRARAAAVGAEPPLLLVAGNPPQAEACGARPVHARADLLATLASVLRDLGLEPTDA